MKINNVLLPLVFLITNLVSSQESCNNLDFETGTFIRWEGGTGVCCPSDNLSLGIVRNRHTIMKGKGVDKNTCDKIAVVAPGGKYSARLGNENIGKEVETLSYTLDVSEYNALFIYKYAVVLQDGGHIAEEQPYFRVSVFKENGELIDPLCGSYNVVATSNLPGFEYCSSNKVAYKDWTTVGLNLSAFIGKKITIEFETGDCTRGGHFGYAYVEAYCSSLKINSTYCADANSVLLSAPIGFSYLWETGETTQTIQIDNPIDGKKYFCELTSTTGCKVDIFSVLTIQEPIIGFKTSNNCDKSEVFFVNTTSNTDNLTNSFLWDFGDGTTSDIENPKHQFTSIGDYDVQFSFSNSLGCSYSMVNKIKIDPNPIPQLSDGFICLDSSGKAVQTYTLDTGLPKDGFTYRWFLNGKLIADAIESTYEANQIGKYSVTAINNETYCLGEIFAMVESFQMPSDIIIKLSDSFVESNFVNVEVIGGTGPFQYQLDATPFQDSNMFRELSYGEHLITVKDKSNCTLVSKQITILGYPKFFTPNNDGYNDYWNIPNYKNFLQTQISIFDRYGKLIVEMTPLELGWDGCHNGNLMPATDYWFTLNYKEKEGNGESKSKSFKSHFSLKR
jgi:gliding motility-associated-like protein